MCFTMGSQRKYCLSKQSIITVTSSGQAHAFVQRSHRADSLFGFFFLTINNYVCYKTYFKISSLKKIQLTTRNTKKGCFARCFFIVEEIVWGDNKKHEGGTICLHDVGRWRWVHVRSPYKIWTLAYITILLAQGCFRHSGNGDLHVDLSWRGILWNSRTDLNHY